MSLTPVRDGSNLLSSLGVDGARMMKGLEQSHSAGHDLKLLHDDFSKTSADLTPAQLADKLQRGAIPQAALKKPDARGCPCPETYAQSAHRFAEASLPRS